MDYARRQRDPGRHMLGIAFVILVHGLVIDALVTGLARKAVEVIKKPTTATIIEEIKAPPPPPPPKPAVRRGISRIAGDDPTYPREAIRAQVTKGRVVVRLEIDEKGNVTDVRIVSSDPPRVFDKAVTSALREWKFRAEGEKYTGEVEVNFTLKDE